MGDTIIQFYDIFSRKIEWKKNKREILRKKNDNSKKNEKGLTLNFEN